MADVYYRYDDESVDEYGTLRLRLSAYPVLKRTPKGAWLPRYFNSWMQNNCKNPRRFVLNEGRKRFAWPSQREALSSFEARRKRQIRIYKARIASAEQALDLAHYERCKLDGTPISRPSIVPAGWTGAENGL